jgi:hypothetical protein
MQYGTVEGVHCTYAGLLSLGDRGLTA